VVRIVVPDLAGVARDRKLHAVEDRPVPALGERDRRRQPVGGLIDQAGEERLEMARSTSSFIDIPSSRAAC